MHKTAFKKEPSGFPKAMKAIFGDPLSSRSHREDLRSSNNFSKKSQVEVSATQCKHHHKELTLFCNSCMQYLCTSCPLTSEHNNHKIHQLKDSPKETVTSLRGSRRVSMDVDIIGLKTEIAKKSKAVQREMEVIKNKMLSDSVFFFSEISGHIEREKQNALKNINEHFDRTNRVLNKRLSAIDLFFKDLDLKLSTANDDSRTKIMVAVHNLRQKMSTLVLEKT